VYSCYRFRMESLFSFSLPVCVAEQICRLCFPACLNAW
jgi:hypothetical protein